MSLLGGLRRLGAGFRLLRAVLRNLDRVATALEQQNEILLAMSPSARAGLAARQATEQVLEQVRDTGPSYVDRDEVLLAEQIRANEFAITGRHLTDEEVIQRVDLELGRI